LAAIFFLKGCYSKEDFVSRNPHPDQKRYGRKVSRQDVNKFLNSVRKIDGRVEAKYRLARYFQKRKKHKIALETLNEVIQNDPTYVNAHNAMGVSYDYLGEFNNAIQSYKRALAINPNLDYVYNNLGFACLLHKKYDEAIDAFQKAIALNGQNKRYRNNLALLYVINDRYDLAINQLKGFEGGPHAGETVGKMARELGKKDFEKQIVSVLQKMKLENNLSRAAKPVSGESDLTLEKNMKPKTKSGDGNSVVISGKIEMSANEKNYSESADDLGPGASEPEGATPSEDDMMVAKNTSDIQLSKNNGHMRTRKAWEETCAKIAEQAEDNPAISIISEAGQDSAEFVRGKPDAASQNDKPHISDDQKVSEQPIFLAASEYHPQPASEKPTTIEKAFRGSSRTLPSNNNAREMSKRSHTKIEPRVVDVAEVFKFSGKNGENPLPVKPAGKRIAVGVDKRSSKTQKLSPVYVTSAASSERTYSKGFSVIEILPLQNDKKTKQAARPDEMKSAKPDKHIVVLEIANGCGVEGMAARIRDLLKENGFKVVKITNTNSPDHISTKIFYYNGHRRTVDRIMQKLSCCADERNIIELENLGNRIKIIIGKDLSPPERIQAERPASGDRS
jgi:Flp pilus assembly protein TadD